MESSNSKSWFSHWSPNLSQPVSKQASGSRFSTSKTQWDPHLGATSRATWQHPPVTLYIKCSFLLQLINHRMLTKSKTPCNVKGEWERKKPRNQKTYFPGVTAPEWEFFFSQESVTIFISGHSYSLLTTRVLQTTLVNFMPSALPRPQAKGKEALNTPIS